MQNVQKEQLKGVDKAWVFVRRNDCCYFLNKFCSILIATGLASVTGYLKLSVADYSQTYPLNANVNSYNLIYWLLFIYYSFTALDELIELYAVQFKREKGALGLLLEMNYFLGVGIIIYITHFFYSGENTVPAEYDNLNKFLQYQVYFFYFVLGLSLLIGLCMSSMQKSFTRKQSLKISDDMIKAD